MMRKHIKPSAVAAYTIVLLAVALTANTAYDVYTRSRRPPTPPWTTVTDWRLFSTRGNRIGPATAPITILVFSDYQCPACTRADHYLRKLVKKHDPLIKIVWRHFPLSFNAHARGAALAAECAAEQNSFLAYHERLFDDPEALGKQSWVAIAAATGVADTAMFNRCFHEARVAAIIDSDLKAAKRLGVFATPTVLINDEEYVGIPWDFNKIVERHVALTAQSVKNTSDLERARF